MARVAVTTAGTLGDFVPFLALGRRLRDRGHDVVMVVNPAMLPQAEAAGLRAAPCGVRFGPEEARRQAELFDPASPITPEQVRENLRRLDLERVYRDLAAACRGVDLLVASSLQGVAGWVREVTGVRWVSGTIFPMEFPHAGDPPPQPPGPLWREVFDYRNAVRAAVGLPPVADDDWLNRYWSDRLILIAGSPHFSQPILDRWPHAHLTGFWFDDPPRSATVTTTGEPRLDEFLAGGPPPLVLTFSSLVVRDAAAVTAAHAVAAARIGRRLVIQRGWAGLGAEHLPPSFDPGAVCFVGHISHAALFPRSAAVIHHGGVGTTAQALRCGRPMLVEPYCNDQFYNAARVAALGIGAALSPRDASADRLAEVLERIVLTEQTQKRVAEVAAAVAAEDGLRRACDLIESQLTS